ncbi:hypothetical protein D3Z70_21975 [Vibrio parahaemolyticus]|nr:hypothetical protein [Vibrio parahaemolyticus]EGR1665899.1 hypothetical protein [Vibrio parahaemolyticus]EGR1787510.1 hypothetical protein [Vibrio parahaemolyticus]EGR2385005.1 hypothetical protein [Vibrio parahaemolyticus]
MSVLCRHQLKECLPSGHLWSVTVYLILHWIDVRRRGQKSLFTILYAPYTPLYLASRILYSSAVRTARKNHSLV